MKRFHSIKFLLAFCIVLFAQKAMAQKADLEGGEASMITELAGDSILEKAKTTDPLPKESEITGVSVASKFGKGLRISDAAGSFHLKFEARFQTLFQGIYDLDKTSDAFDGEMMIRRARLKFSGFVYKPGFEYKIELGLSNRDIEVKGRDSDYANIILDAYMRFKLHENLKLRVGQFKMPGNRERIISSGDLQMVDRSIINSKFNIDRDAGFMLENKTTLGNVVMRQFAAVSSGEGRNRLSKDAGFCYSGRFEFLPLGEFSGKGDLVESAIDREESPKLSVGMSYSYNDNAQRSRGQLGNTLFESRDLTIMETDFMFKFGGFSAMGEAAIRDVDNPITANLESQETEYVYKGKGWNLQTGYMFKNNWEIATRVSDLRPDREIQSMTDRQTDYTVAVSKFWVGHKLKVQGDVTYSKKTALVGSRSDRNFLIARITTNMNF